LTLHLRKMFERFDGLTSSSCQVFLQVFPARCQQNICSLFAGISEVVAEMPSVIPPGIPPDSSANQMNGRCHSAWILLGCSQFTARDTSDARQAIPSANPGGSLAASPATMTAGAARVSAQSPPGKPQDGCWKSRPGLAYPPPRTVVLLRLT